MRAPKCCKKRMVMWTQSSTTEMRTTLTYHWHCDECDKDRPLYRKPWIWFWLVCDREAIEDQVVHIPWWMGRIANLEGWRYNREETFTVIPLNVLISLVTHFWQRCRFQVESQWSRELRRAYEDGLDKNKVVTNRMSARGMRRT